MSPHAMSSWCDLQSRFLFLRRRIGDPSIIVLLVFEFFDFPLLCIADAVEPNLPPSMSFGGDFNVPVIVFVVCGL